MLKLHEGQILAGPSLRISVTSYQPQAREARAPGGTNLTGDTKVVSFTHTKGAKNEK